MASIICVNCGVLIDYSKSDKTPKVCPRCKKNPCIKEDKAERIGRWEPKKKKTKYFKDDGIEEVKHGIEVPEVQDELGSDD